MPHAVPSHLGSTHPRLSFGTEHLPTRHRDNVLPPRHLDLPRCVHDDGHADQADTGAEEIPSVGPEVVERHPPRERTRDEDASVCGQHSPKVCVGLKSGDESVTTQGDHAETYPDPTAMFTNALPHQPGSTDFGERSTSEYEERARDVHGAHSGRSHCWRGRGDSRV